MNTKKSDGGSMGLLLAAVLMAIVFIYVFPSLSLANDGALGSFDDSGTHLRQEGSLFTVRLSKGSPVRIFVAGREEAKVDPLLLKVTVRRLKPYLGKTFTADRFGSYFTVPDEADLEKATALEVTTQMKDQNEIFHFDVNPESP